MDGGLLLFIIQCMTGKAAGLLSSDEQARKRNRSGASTSTSRIKKVLDKIIIKKEEIAEPRPTIYRQRLFYSHNSQRWVHMYQPSSVFGFGCKGGRVGWMCLHASASVVKILLCRSRMTQSSVFLLNFIVTNDGDDVTTEAFVTYFPQMRK